MSGQVEPQSVLVLIADDEEPIAQVVAAVVEDAGYVPIVAVHGRQALELARSHQPLLLITDLMMPLLDGAQLIAQLRSDAAKVGCASVPIILMTAASLQVAQQAGADAILRKPFDIEDLEELLLRFLGPAVA